MQKYIWLGKNDYLWELFKEMKFDSANQWQMYKAIWKTLDWRKKWILFQFEKKIHQLYDKHDSCSVSPMKIWLK